MLLRAISLVAVMCSGALAQDCTASGEDFQFCTNVLDMDIFWNYRPNDATPSVDILVQSSEDGWHSVGFSSGSGASSMSPANVVIACFDAAASNVNAAAADYNVLGRVRPTQAGNQGLLNFTQSLDGDCSFRFTRPISPAGIPDDQQLTDRMQRVIAARGGDALARHSNADRVAFDVNFATGENNGGSSLYVSTPTMLVAAIVGAIVAALF